MKILILCTGNCCRSQMAQGWLQSFDQSLTVCSAGTEPGKEVNKKAIQVMAEVSIDINNQYPKNISLYLNEGWDYLITVCDNARETCPVFIGNVKHRVHIGFEDPSQVRGTDEFALSEFRRVRDEMRERLYEFYLRNLKLID
jgi:arsenate reductase